MQAQEKIDRSQVRIVKGQLNYAKDFARLMVISSPVMFPFFFGKRPLSVLENIYKKSQHLFSKDHTWFVVTETDNVVGMLLAYDWKTKEKEESNTGKILFSTIPFTMIKNTKFFLMTRDVLGIVKPGEMFISNVAVYKKYRWLGFGKMLLKHAEKIGKKRNAQMMALEVETENAHAKNVYIRMGYKIEWKTPTWHYKGRTLEFYRMIKPLKRQ